MINLFAKRNTQKKPVLSSTNSTQNWIPIRDVYDSVIHRKDGYLVAGIFVSPVNIHLLGDTEKVSIIHAFEEVLNGIDEDFQIISIGKPVDLDGYINYLNTKRLNEHNFIKQRLLANYMNTAAHMATSGEALDRMFYILIQQKTSKNYQMDKNDLLSRANRIALNLSGSGLKADVCNDEQLRDLLFVFFNQNQAAYERAPEGFTLPTIFDVKGS